MNRINNDCLRYIREFCGDTTKFIVVMRKKREKNSKNCSIQLVFNPKYKEHEKIINKNLWFERNHEYYSWGSDLPPLTYIKSENILILSVYKCFWIQHHENNSCTIFKFHPIDIYDTIDPMNRCIKLTEGQHFCEKGYKYKFSVIYNNFEQIIKFGELIFGGEPQQYYIQ